MASRHLVITVHGIRTFGNWQERLESLIRAAAQKDGKDITVLNYKYGYFSAFALLSLTLRFLTVRRFARALADVARQPWDRIDIVAHSFGTYLVALALRSLSSSQVLKIHTVVLAGSVLPARFDWSTLIPHRVARVINECGTNDNVLWLSQAVPLLGMAGRTGFNGMTGAALRNRFFAFGHSGYFMKASSPSDAFMEDQWLPHFLAEREVVSVDERRSTWLTPVEAFLLNNAKPTKLVAYVAAVAVLLVVGLPLGQRLYAVNRISAQHGYVSNEKGRVKVWFDAAATPDPTMPLIGWLGPVHDIDLAQTHLSDEGFEQIRPPDTVETLDVAGTDVTRLALAVLTRFPALTSLRLTGIPLGSLEGFFEWHGLKDLDLDDTGLHDADLRHLSALREVESLSLSENSIQGEGLGHLQGLGKLRALYLNDTPIDDSGLMQLPPLPNLRELVLQNTSSLLGPGLAAVGHLTSLEELWLRNSNVDNDGLKYLSGLTRLRILSLPGTRVGHGGFEAVKNLPNLKELYLGATAVSDEDMIPIGQMPSLETLFIPGGRVTDAGAEHLLKSETLRRLNIDGTLITIAGRERIRKQRPKIEFAHLE